MADRNDVNKDSSSDTLQHFDTTSLIIWSAPGRKIVAL